MLGNLAARLGPIFDNAGNIAKRIELYNDIREKSNVAVCMELSSFVCVFACAYNLRLPTDLLNPHGKSRPDYDRCMTISTKSALRDGGPRRAPLILIGAPLSSIQGVSISNTGDKGSEIDNPAPTS
eukprot:gene44330-55129_t